MPKNEGYFDFSLSVKKFENGQIEPVEKDNSYLKVLSELNNCEYAIKGKRLAQNMGVDSVKEELRVLTIMGLNEHPARTKNTISKKGIDYLEVVGSKK